MALLYLQDFSDTRRRRLHGSAQRQTGGRSVRPPQTDRRLSLPDYNSFGQKLGMTSRALCHSEIVGWVAYIFRFWGGGTFPLFPPVYPRLTSKIYFINPGKKNFSFDFDALILPQISTTILGLLHKNALYF